jgi:hypothetical protein
VDRDKAIKALVGLRTGIGVGAWLTPRLAGRLFGLDPRGNPQAPYLSRLFGARDFALAAGVLGAQGDAQRQWLIAGLACDVADSLAGIAGGRGGYLPAVTTVLVTGTALSAVALGAVALSGDASTS